MSTLAILGASGHGKVVADIALAMGHFTCVVFFDDAWPDKKANGKYEIIGNSDELKAFAKREKASVFVALGNNNIRFLKLKQLVEHGLQIATLVHPSASVSTSAMIGDGSVIMPGAVINADATIGDAAIVNTLSAIEHDCKLGNAVHISPGAALAGGVQVGDFSWIGIGASVVQQIAIGSNVVIGAGAAVVCDVPDNVTAVGVPARVIKSKGEKC